MAPCYRFACLSILTFGIATLTGCGVTGTPIGTSNASTSASLHGSVHGGQQPVVGATVQLMVPGTAGYGSPASVLATTITLSGGGFTLPAYTCPANSGDVYLLATGGNAGSGINPALAEAALLGPCNSLRPSTFISLTEVTTVAAAYALAPFASVTTSSTGIGAPATNLQGLTNAFAAAYNLAPYPSGTAQAPGALPGVVLPQAEMNTLANILASCVNSNGSTVATAPCGMLFADATPPAGVAPVDTFQAALNIALNPGTNVGALFTLSSANAPFQPALTATPNDFAVGIEYTGGAAGSISSFNGLAIDSLGNAWVVTGAHSLIEISPAGVYLSGATGYGSTTLNSPQGVAIDSSNNVYVTDYNSNRVVKFAPNGSVTGSLGPASLGGPLGLAIDADNSLWVTDNGSSRVSHLTSAGADAAGSPFSAFYNPFETVLNSAGTWTIDSTDGQSNSSLTNITTAGVDTPYPITGHGYGLGLDRTGYVWYSTVSSNGSTLGRENPAGGSTFTPVLLPSQYSGHEVFIDGLNTIWLNTQNNVAFNSPGAVLRYSNAGALITPATGYQANGAVVSSGVVPEGLAVDGSGNLWVSGYQPAANGSAQPIAFVTELIGAAGPVVTPIAVAAAGGKLGTRP